MSRHALVDLVMVLAFLSFTLAATVIALVHDLHELEAQNRPRMQSRRRRACSRVWE